MYCPTSEQVYLDTAGASLFSSEQLDASFSALKRLRLGNPHSGHSSGRLTGDLVKQLRIRILSHFNTTSVEYSVVFTQGATDALRILAENFDYLQTTSIAKDKISRGINDDTTATTPCFAYLSDNHTSVVGMREYAKVKAVPWYCIQPDNFKQKLDGWSAESDTVLGDSEGRSLFVYPAQSNFNGRKYPLKSWISRVQSGCLGPGRWYVYLDAAAFVSTNHLDLQECHPDFVAVSFYKIFGYPTGIGALLVRNTSANVLSKRYFGGGTVYISLPVEDFHAKRDELSERFEDGTINYQSIVALQYGFEMIEKQGGIEEIARRTFALTKFTYDRLSELKHANGSPVVQIYSSHSNYDSPSEQGPIINFNMLRDDGSWVGYNEVSKMAELYNIELRTGCFCNQGACQSFLKLTDETLRKNFQKGKVCGDTMDLLDGLPVGSVRISYGWHSSTKDALAFLGMVYDCFLTVPIRSWRKYSESFQPFLPSIEPICVGSNTSTSDAIQNFVETSTVTGEPRVIPFQPPKSPHLVSISLYPVKSCAAMSVTRWRLCTTGLEYDRKWMLVTDLGICMTQKRYAAMCTVRPNVDLKRQMLVLKCGNNFCELPLELDSESQKTNANSQESTVCADRVASFDCGDKIAQFLSTNLRISDGCRLHRFDEKIALRSSQKAAALSLANEAQFLLLNRASIRELCTRIGPSLTISVEEMTERFRANFVIDGPTIGPFAEDNWSTVAIGRIIFTVVGKCTRCQMICIDQNTGEKNVEVLKTIRDIRKGQMTFGIYLAVTSEENGDVISVGDQITWT